MGAMGIMVIAVLPSLSWLMGWAADPSSRDGKCNSRRQSKKANILHNNYTAARRRIGEKLLNDDDVGRTSRSRLRRESSREENILTTVCRQPALNSIDRIKMRETRGSSRMLWDLLLFCYVAPVRMGVDMFVWSWKMQLKQLCGAVLRCSRMLRRKREERIFLISNVGEIKVKRWSFYEIIMNPFFRITLNDHTRNCMNLPLESIQLF